MIFHSGRSSLDSPTLTSISGSGSLDDAIAKYFVGGRPVLELAVRMTEGNFADYLQSA